MLRIDLEAAGIPYTVEGPDGPLYADFHALRHSYLTLGGRAGIDLRTLQELAGHSTPMLTARYSHCRLHDLAGAVEQLPSILPKTPAPGMLALRATGTDSTNASASVDRAYTAITQKSDSECISVRLIETGTEDALRIQKAASADARRALRVDESDCDGLREEAPPGFEPGMADLQSAALPLGEGAVNPKQFRNYVTFLRTGVSSTTPNNTPLHLSPKLYNKKSGRSVVSEPAVVHSEPVSRSIRHVRTSSYRATPSVKPNKPYADFPLFAHAAGVWAKKIRGKLYYFGKWDNWQDALAKYEREKDGLEAGRKPTPVQATPSTPTDPDGVDKPAKPYPEFPLFPHASGQWAKKIRGKLYYFGKWDYPEAALESYNQQKDDLHAGRIPRKSTETTTVARACNEFLTHKTEMVSNSELSPRTLAEYKEACQEIVSAFGNRTVVVGLRVENFAKLRTRMARKWGPRRLGKMIQCVRCVFKYALDAELIDKAVRFGPEFKQPSKKVLRLHRAQKGQQLFAAEEIRRLTVQRGFR